MMMNSQFSFIAKQRWHSLCIFGLMCAVALGLAACGGGQAIPTAAADQTGTTVNTDTQPTPTTAVVEAELIPTFEPLAAMVNGQPILLEDYEAAVARRRAAFESLGQPLPEEGLLEMDVLEQLIDESLMIQAAEQAGVQVSPEEVEAAYQASVAEQGTPEAFAEWLAFSQLTEAQFRAQLYNELLIGQIASQIADSVPAQLPQVNASHILVAEEQTARELLARIQNGEDFATLAVQFSQDQSSRINGGNLGWFPRGVLTVANVEDVAFSLAAGETSDVVQSFLGFHIIQTIQTAELYPVSPEVRAVLQRNAVDSWLANLRTQAIVERFVP